MLCSILKTVLKVYVHVQIKQGQWRHIEVPFIEGGSTACAHCVARLLHALQCVCSDGDDCLPITSILFAFSWLHPNSNIH